MIKFILCEDNPEGLNIAIKTITKTMMNYDIEYKIHKFSKYDKELKKIINDEFCIKIYILDIELPVVSGLEIASEIRENDDDSSIIFVTAHPECKNDIFYSRLGAIDFISKYYRYEERLEDTIKYLVNKMYKNKVLSFTCNRVHTKLLYKEINYIEKESSQNRCIIHLTNGEEKIINSSITKLKEEIGDYFYQTHKSCLVNIDNIKNIEYAKFKIEFNNGEVTTLLSPLSRKGLRERVGDY